MILLKQVRAPMEDSAKQKRAYRILAVIFGIAGVVWIVSGFFTTSWILYPLIGFVTLGIAYVCKKAAA